jgi:hypothetical protein
MKKGYSLVQVVYITVHPEFITMYENVYVTSSDNTT